MTTPPSLTPSFSSPPPNWFARNWKWALALGLLGGILLLAAFVGSILLIVETSFQHSGFYSEALARARANPQVTEKIGLPLQAGWLASGSMNTSGPSGSADVSIPISGPKGKGTIYVVAKKSAGEWKFRTLQVEIEGETSRIDLLKPEEIIPKDN